MKVRPLIKHRIRIRSRLHENQPLLLLSVMPVSYI